MDPIRESVRQASFGAGAEVPIGWISEGMQRPPGFPDSWRALQYLENHDEVYARADLSARKPRIARLADASDPRSWWARSRSRVASGLLLCAPGIPMLFMGQEVLEDKNWSDDLRNARGTLVWWEGLESDRAMRDHLRFMRELLWLRRGLPALRGETLNVYHARNDSRVLAFHRWIPGVQDVVVVASFNESTYERYQLGFPLPGRWREAFNADFYDPAPNTGCAGNSGAVTADGGGQDGLDWSTSLVIPANGLLVFVR